MKGFIALLCCVLLHLSAGVCPPGICPQQQTCCAGPAPGVYGCCPSPQAVCCSDGLHCCPTNTVCDVEKQQCVPQGSGPAPGVVYCPGGVSYCPNGSTCCLLPTGQYGCCPYPQAICCSDRIHCCPYGTRCDATSQYCLQGRVPAPFRRMASLIGSQ